MVKDDFFHVYDYRCNLESGKQAIIDLSIFPDTDKLPDLLKMYVSSSSEKMGKRVKDSQLAEKVAYDKCIQYVKHELIRKMEIVKLAQLGLELSKIQPKKHTSNVWKTERENFGTSGDYDIREEISNTVYRMNTYMSVNRKYQKDVSPENREVEYVEVNWSLIAEGPKQNNEYNENIKILDGQERKKFKTVEDAEKYLSGRKKAMSKYFQEVNPVVPADLKQYFTFYNVPLPGYRYKDEVNS